MPYAGLAFSLSGMLIAPFVGKITKKFGKKEAGSVSLIVAGLVYIAAYFFKIQNPLVYVGIVLISGLSMGYYMMATYSYVTDVIDDYQINTGERKDGTIYSVYSFIRKVGQALADFIAGSSLTWIGYQESTGAQAVSQNTEVQEGIYSLATLVPGFAFLIAGLILLFLYPLNKARVEKNEEIMTRNN